MLRLNLKLFGLCLVAIFLLILLKNSQIFDFGVFVRTIFVPKDSVNSLLAPGDNLQQDYQKLLVANAKLLALKSENEQLRNLLNFREEKRYNLELANILSRDPINKNLLLINAGSNKGVNFGQAVVVNNGIMVGKISAVNADSAVVRLVIDNGSKIAVRVGDEQSVSGVLTGSFGLGMSLSFIPQSQEIKKNDLVYTSDLNPDIPAGLVVGRIGEIKAEAEELFKVSTVDPIIDLNTLTVVAIIK
ncbi:MAG: rod shape-determining protein MreC [Patescibacteria group bacterium]|jgi:rod shape-determining protein MreC